MAYIWPYVHVLKGTLGPRPGSVRGATRFQQFVSAKVLIVVSSHFKIGQLEEKRQKIMKKVQKTSKNHKKVKQNVKIRQKRLKNH